jgi:hypothetical protein
MAGRAFPIPHNARERTLQRRSTAGSLWGYAAYGFILGVLVWTAALRLGIDAIPDFSSPHIVLLAGVAGAVLAQTRARILFGVASAGVCIALLFVMYTPVSAVLVRGVTREDPPQRVEAVVILHPEIQRDGTLTDRTKASVLRGVELLRQGYARTLVLTRPVPPDPSVMPAVRRQLRELRLDYPLAETGPSENTHDEAVAVSALTADRAWKQVILVSHPTHMRRAGAVFERAGVPVLCAPSPEGRYDLSSLSHQEDRLHAFRDWLHEAIGYEVYRWRGWVE